MRNKNVQFMALSALIIAVIAAMSFIPNVGYISIPGTPISITTLPIAVLLFAWIFGWKAGVVAGLSFGVLSMIRAYTLPVSAFDPYFVNPLVSVFPRLLFGFVAGIVFDLLRLIRKPGLRFWLDVIALPILVAFHTVVTLTMYFIVNGTDQFNQIIGILFSINGGLEMGGALILVPLIVLPLDKAFPKYEAIYHTTLSTRKKATVYETITQSYKEDLISNLKKFVAINSVYDEKTVSKTNPFGKGVSNALDFIATLAKQDGFEVNNYANKVVEIISGEGKNITILAHADVVPAGTGWNQDPFEMVDHGDTLTGRGVADDKGPLLAAYYAMKAIRDNHMQGDYQIRFIVGGNEESGSAGVKYYFEKLKKPQPDFGFSPDAEYPLIFAEKGIINFEVKKKVACKHLISIKGGVASNSVIEKCVVTADVDHDFIKYVVDNHYDADYEVVDNKVIFTFHGKAAHGSTPEEGVNAGMLALKACANYFTNKDLLDVYSKYENLQGYGVNAYGNSDEMGHNSLNVGIINYEDNQFSMIVNFRYVDACNSEELKENIKKASKPFAIEIEGESPLLYYKKDCDLITILLNAYREETGDLKSEPKAIGGGTYAKEAQNIVAFGMEFPGWNSYMHSPGEQVKKADLFKSISIYAKAIADLGKKLEEKDAN